MSRYFPKSTMMSLSPFFVDVFNKHTFIEFFDICFLLRIFFCLCFVYMSLSFFVVAKKCHFRKKLVVIYHNRNIFGTIFMTFPHAQMPKIIVIFGFHSCAILLFIRFLISLFSNSIFLTTSDNLQN